MEAELAALDQELRRLNEENARLEKVYFIKMLTDFKEGYDVAQRTADIEKWLSSSAPFALGSLPEQEGSAHSVYLTGKTIGWNLDSFTSKILAMTDTTHTSQVKTIWSNRNYANVSVRMELTVAKNLDNDHIQVSSLAIAASDENTAMPELDPLIKECCSLCEPHRFFLHFDTYIGLYLARETFLKDQGMAIQMNNKTGHFRINFNSDQNTPLARVSWFINFDPLADTFIESYEVQLTEDGIEAALKYNFPEELIERGFYPDWSATDCLSNLAQMSLMPESPDKKKKRS